MDKGSVLLITGICLLRFILISSTGLDNPEEIDIFQNYYSSTHPLVWVILTFIGIFPLRSEVRPGGIFYLIFFSDYLKNNAFIYILKKIAHLALVYLIVDFIIMAKVLNIEHFVKSDYLFVLHAIIGYVNSLVIAFCFLVGLNSLMSIVVWALLLVLMLPEWEINGRILGPMGAKYPFIEQQLYVIGGYDFMISIGILIVHMLLLLFLLKRGNLKHLVLDFRNS